MCHADSSRTPPAAGSARRKGARALLALVFMVFAGTPRAQLVEESGSFLEFMAGTEPAAAYDNWISHVSEGIARPGYNVYAPEELDPQLDGFGAFELLEDDPWGNSVLNMFRDCVTHLLEGDPDGALAAVEGGPDVDYELVRFSDGGTGREYYLLRERLNHSYFDPGFWPGPADDVVGSFDHGWGLFAVSPAASRPNVIVQMPHPNDDYLSPYLGLFAFRDFDAGLLMINGAGREVLWQGEQYNNGRSLSDPTRNCFTPFAAVHQATVDHLRNLGMRELVLQIHSYDDQSHRDLKSCVIAAGRHDQLIFQPLYDTGGGALGLLNNLLHPVHAENAFGFEHAAVDLAEYVASNPLQNLLVDGGTPGQEIWIGKSPDLIGYPQNCQERYCLDDLADCGELERFLHIETDELPSIAHEAAESTWYAIEEEQPATWLNFQNCGVYYGPLFQALFQAEDSLQIFADDQPPSDPAGLQLLDLGVDRVTLGWNFSRSSFFDSYEILMDSSGAVTPDAILVDSGDIEQLCWPPLRSVEIRDLEYQTTYAFILRALDFQGRYSAWTDTVLATPDDQVPPQWTPQFSGSWNVFWLGLAGGELRFRVRDLHNQVDLSSLELRLDMDGNGAYAGMDEEWQNQGFTGLSPDTTLEIPLQFADPGCRRFELRVHDDQHQLWGYTGTAGAEGIDDDHSFCVDLEAPVQLGGLHLEEIHPDASIRFAWDASPLDSTFYSVRLHFASFPIADPLEAEWKVDRSLDGELDDPDLDCVTLDSLLWPGQTVWMLADETDWAGNAGPPSEALEFEYLANTWCYIEEFDASIESGFLVLSWAAGCIFPGLMIEGYDLYRSQEPWTAPLPEDLLLQTSETSVQLEWLEQAAYPGSAFYRVVARFHWEE